MRGETRPMTDTGQDSQREWSPTRTIVLWHPLPSSFCAAETGTVGVLILLLLIGLLMEFPFLSSPQFDGFWITVAVCLGAFPIRGAIVFVAFTSGHILVVNSLRILRLPAGNIEYLGSKTWHFAGAHQVLAVVVRGRRRAVPILAVPLSVGRHWPGGKVFQSRRIQQVHAWAVERRIPPFHEPHPPSFLSGVSLPPPRPRPRPATPRRPNQHADASPRGPDPAGDTALRRRSGRRPLRRSRRRH
jgi:hypothetical protein